MAAKSAIVKAAFELKSSHVYEKHSHSGVMQYSQLLITWAFQGNWKKFGLWWVDYITENKEISIWVQRECNDMYHAHFTSRAARDLLIFLKKVLKQQYLDILDIEFELDRQRRHRIDGFLKIVIIRFLKL